MSPLFPPRYDTLVGTIGKKYSTKRNRSAAEDDSPQDRDSDTTSSTSTKKFKGGFMKPKD